MFGILWILFAPVFAAIISIVIIDEWKKPELFLLVFTVIFYIWVIPAGIAKIIGDRKVKRAKQKTTCCFTLNPHVMFASFALKYFLQKQQRLKLTKNIPATAEIRGAHISVSVNAVFFITAPTKAKLIRLKDFFIKVS